MLPTAIQRRLLWLVVEELFVSPSRGHGFVLFSLGFRRYYVWARKCHLPSTRAGWYI